MTDQPFIQLEKITKTYGRGHTSVQALHNITLSVPPGSYWAIMGPSGSGKSTLLHLLGLLDRPGSGRLTIDRTTITHQTNVAKLSILRRELIGFIFQQFYLLPRLTALENVALPGLYSGQSARAARDRAYRLLENVGLTERARHRPNQLSGGEQQRVAIARALMNEPALILADEPTGNLDSRSGANILELIESLNAKGKTILLVTHDPTVGQRAQKIIELQDGRLEGIMP